MTIIIIGILLVFFLIATQTLWFHPTSTNSILETEFSTIPDLWQKKEGNKNLAIFLHGMYSSPDTFQELSEQIVHEGWDIYVPTLPNASLSPEDLSEQASYQWEDSLKVALHRALVYNKDYKKIVLAGHSQGGSLALSIAPSLPFLSGLIIVASPLHIIHKNNSFIRNTAIFLSGLLVFLIPKKGMFLNSSNAYERSLVDGHYSDKEFYFGLTLHSMKLGLKKTVKQLPQIKTPCLLIYEKGDKITDFQDFITIKNSISSTIIKECILNTPIELEPYSKRHRLLSYIYTKDQVFEEITSFLKTIA
ncbi:MAG: alpha/beta hydrolase [Brevinema sp.]